MPPRGNDTGAGRVLDAARADGVAATLGQAALRKL
jgi:hypothetical protein